MDIKEILNPKGWLIDLGVVVEEESSGA